MGNFRKINKNIPSPQPINDANNIAKYASKHPRGQNM